MIKANVSEVLRAANYLMTYHFSSKNEEGILSWGKESWNVKYDTEYQCIVGTLFGDPVKCPAYFIPALLKARISQFCEQNKYPSHYVECYLDGEPTAGLCFQFTDNYEEAMAAMRFAEIYADVVRYGLQPDAVEVSTPEEIQFILKNIFNITATVSK